MLGRPSSKLRKFERAQGFYDQGRGPWIDFFSSPWIDFLGCWRHMLVLDAELTKQLRGKRGFGNRTHTINAACLRLSDRTKTLREACRLCGVPEGSHSGVARLMKTITKLLEHGQHQARTLSSDPTARQVYNKFGRQLDILQTGGSFSLDLAPRCVSSIARLLQLQDGDRLLWIGCGCARELLSLAILLRDVRFTVRAIDNATTAPTMFALARSVALGLGASSDDSSTLQLHGCTIHFEMADALGISSDPWPTHIYTTAMQAGALLAEHIPHLGSATRRICMFEDMWLYVHHDESVMQKERVSLSGSNWSTNLMAGGSEAWS